MKRIGIEISATIIRYDFVTISLRFFIFVTNPNEIVTEISTPIRFIRPSLVPVFSSCVYIEDGIWSDETDWKRNLGLLRFVTISLRVYVVTISKCLL